MLDRERIFTWFRRLARLDGDESAIWRALCETTACMLEGRLREGLDLDTEMERLCMAAAGITHARYLSFMQPHGQNEELRVGDITLKNTSATKTEAHSEERYLREIADLLRPEGFVFAAIREVEP